MIRAQAAITDGEGNFVIDEIEVDDPQHGEVLVQMKAAGVCHTDYHRMFWGDKIVLGHEGAGTVQAVGPGV